MEEDKVIKICVVMDEDGDYAVGLDMAAAIESYNGTFEGTAIRQHLSIVIRCPAPKAIKLNAVIPPETLANKGLPVTMTVSG